MSKKDIHRKTMNWNKDLIDMVNDVELPGYANDFCTDLTSKLHYLVRKGLNTIQLEKSLKQN